MKALQLFIIMLTIAFVSCTKKTQTSNSRNDSVEKYLKLASIDTLPIETRKVYNKKAFSFIDLERNDSNVIRHLSEITLNNIKIRDCVNYYKTSKIHFEKSKKVEDDFNTAKFYQFRGDYHRVNSLQFDSAFFFYIKAEKIFYKINDFNGLGTVFLRKGDILSNINDFSSAELEYLKAEKILKQTKNQGKTLELLNNKGVNYDSQFEIVNAINSYEEGLSLIEKRNNYADNNQKAYFYSNIGQAYIKRRNYKKAIYYLNIALKNINKFDDRLKCSIFSKIAFCNMMCKKNDNLIQQFNRVLKISKENNFSEITFEILINLSNLSYSQKDSINAQKYSNEALLLAKKSKVPYNIMNAWKQIGIVDKERASEAIIQFDIQVDSLLNKERRERSKFLKIQLETDEITQEKEKAIKQKWVQTSIIATVLLIVILLFIIFKQRSQKKEFVLIQNQQKSNEEIYQLMLNQQAKEEEAKQKEKKRIALELHDNVMNKLASTRFNLFTLTQKQDDPTLQNAVQHIDKIKDIEDEIRNITHELSKETFSKSNSFTSLLAQLIEQQNQLHPTDFNLEIDPKINWDSIASEIKMNYYRIIQEAIHNTNKYAKATKSTVSLLLEENKLRLSISDNGVGFETNTTKQGIGIQNMQQRITAINGEITINSAPGKGTVINCSVEI